MQAADSYGYDQIAIIRPENGGVGSTTSIGQITDMSPAKQWAQMVGRQWALAVMPSTFASQPTQPSSHTDVIDASWFKEALARLADAKSALQGDEDQAEVLEEAEFLIAHFAAWPEEIRPQFSIDAIGRPSFSAKTQRFYLHATLDNEIGLDWFAKLDGVAYNDDGDEDFRSHLPKKLAALAANH